MLKRRYDALFCLRFKSMLSQRKIKMLEVETLFIYVGEYTVL